MNCSLLLQYTEKAGSILNLKKKKLDQTIQWTTSPWRDHKKISQSPKIEVVLGAWGKSTAESDQAEQCILLPLSETPVRAKGTISLAQQGFSYVLPASPGHLGVSNSSQKIPIIIFNNLKNSTIEKIGKVTDNPKGVYCLLFIFQINLILLVIKGARTFVSFLF